MHSDTAVRENASSPDKVYYGPETAKAKDYLNLCETTLEKYPQILVAMGKVKKACAMTNRQVQALETKRANAIAAACDELIAGQFMDQFLCAPLAGLALL